MEISANKLFEQISHQITNPTKTSSTTEEISSPSSFGNLLKAAVNEVQASEDKAHTANIDFQEGKSNVAIHDVMISMQKASLNFQTLVQTRNKLVQAYQQISQMGI